MKTINVRMTYNTLKRIKHIFPAERGETAAHYFLRLAKWLELKGGRK